MYACANKLQKYPSKPSWTQAIQRVILDASSELRKHFCRTSEPGIAIGKLAMVLQSSAIISLSFFISLSVTLVYCNKTTSS